MWNKFSLLAALFYGNLWRDFQKPNMSGLNAEDFILGKDVMYMRNILTQGEI